MAAIEDSLLESARGGDPAALEELLTRQQNRIYRFGLKMCRDPEDARDVLQETLFSMAKGIKSFRGDSSLATWAYAIARSFCIKKRRKSVFAPEEEVSFEADDGESLRSIADPGRSPEQIVDDRRLAEALDRAIGSLEPAYRDVLILRDAEGLSAREVAEIMDLSVEAVKSRLHRARIAIRERLSGWLPSLPAAADRDRACPDVQVAFSRHLEGDISPTDCAEMERHLSACPRCQAACDGLKRVLAVCRTAEAPAVPREVQDSIKERLKGLLAGRA